MGAHSTDNTAAERELMRRCVIVNDDERLILDKDRGLTRCVHYRRIRPNENFGGIDRTLFNRLHGAGFLPDSKPGDWVRTASQAKDLDTAVRYALKDSNSRGDLDTILLYIRSMGWGW